jgi:hypothetical protein
VGHFDHAAFGGKPGYPSINPQCQDLSEEKGRAGKEPGFSARHAENDRIGVIVNETAVTLLFAALRTAAHLYLAAPRRLGRPLADSLARLASSPSVRCGYCPHPRAPGALALSLDRERDLKNGNADGIKKITN